MENIDQLRFVSTKKQTTAQSNFFFEEEKKEEVKYEDVDEKPELWREPKKVNENEITVKYRGKQCTKRDIEDWFARNEKKKPTEPDPEDCCGTGCQPCVFDTYDNAIIRYEDNKEELEGILLEFEDDPMD